MKKEMIVLLLIGILLASPLVLAQEQAQTYSGFDRFIDNVKMFFSSGDNKVRLASKIREKEINSAIVNTKNEDDEEAEKNLKRAWKRLQFIQEKVSFDTAKEMKENSEEVRMMIVQEGNLSNDFAVYVLEEEKTGLKAEWVIAVEGEEGQTSTSEVVGEANGERVVEIEIRMDEVDVEIKEWVVDSFDKTIDSDSGLTWEVANKIIKEDDDDGLTREVKTYVAGGNDVDDGAPGPQGIVGDAGDGGMAPGTTAGGPPIDSSDGDCGEGVVCGGEGDVIDSPAGEDVIDNGATLDDTDASDDTVDSSDE